MKADSDFFSYRRLSAAPSNKIFIFKSLGPEEKDTAEQIYEHIVISVNTERRKSGEPDVVPVSVTLKSKQHLIRLLKDIESECKNGVVPIIHLETHGSELGLGIILESSKHELITWVELIDLFRGINVACQGYLTIVLAACHSFRIENLILKQQRKSPFFSLIGYEEKICSKDIILDLSTLYDFLLLKNTLPYDENASLESFTLYTEYDLALSLISVLLINRTDPASVAKQIPPFEKLLEGPPLAPGLSEVQRRKLYEEVLKSEKILLNLAELMQNQNNVVMLKQDIRRHIQTHFKD